METEIKNDYLIDYTAVKEIPMMEWDIITEKYGVNSKAVAKDLMKPNQSNNFWYPYEWSLDESEVAEFVKVFRLRYPDTDIKSLHNYKYTEVFLNTIEKHQFTYTLLNLIKNK